MAKCSLEKKNYVITLARRSLAFAFMTHPPTGQQNECGPVMVVPSCAEY
jgi:hypothetical protein